MKELITLEKFKNLNEITQNIDLIKSLSKATELNLLEQIEVYYKKEDIKKAIQGDTILLVSNTGSVDVVIFDEIKGDYIYCINLIGESIVSSLSVFNPYKITKINDIL